MADYRIRSLEACKAVFVNIANAALKNIVQIVL